MRAVWTALGLSLAVLTAVGTTRWYLDYPRDLQLQAVAVDTPATSYTRHAGVANVAQITFTSRSDLRAMVFSELLTVTRPLVLPCSCYETKTGNADRLCMQNLGDVVYDDSGYISTYNTAASSSRSGPDENARVSYSIFEPLVRKEAGRTVYDFTRHPFDLCVQIERTTLFVPFRKSNVLKISKVQLAAAIAMARNMPPFREPNLKDPNLPVGELSDRF